MFLAKPICKSDSQSVCTPHTDVTVVKRRPRKCLPAGGFQETSVLPVLYFVPHENVWWRNRRNMSISRVVSNMGFINTPNTNMKSAWDRITHDITFASDELRRRGRLGTASWLIILPITCSRRAFFVCNIQYWQSLIQHRVHDQNEVHDCLAHWLKGSNSSMSDVPTGLLNLMFDCCSQV